MGLIPEAGDSESKKGSKVVVYPADSTVPAVYEGACANRLSDDSLSRFAEPLQE